LVLKTIDELKRHDETSHIEKPQVCGALARGVLNLKPGEEPARVLEDELEIRESRFSLHSPYHFRFDG